MLPPGEYKRGAVLPPVAKLLWFLFLNLYRSERCELFFRTWTTVDLWSSPKPIHWRVAASDSRNVFSRIMYLMKHICVICSSHRNDHRTSSIDCDLHKLMNVILCELRNLKDLLSLSLLITTNNILSGVFNIIAFYVTFYVAFLLHRIVLYSVYMYRIVAIPKFVHSFITFCTGV